MIKQTVQDFVSVEKKLFKSDDQHSNVFDKEMVRLKHLPVFLDQLLNQYDAADLLTWHSGTIPNHEIWVKLGGGPWQKFT